MDFLKTLKQTLQVNRSEFLSYGAAAALGGIGGIILVLIIMAVEGSGEDYGKIGSLMALIMGTAVLLFGGIFSVQSDFNLAISMGKIRKYFVPSQYLMLLLDTLMVWGIATLINLTEGALYEALYPGAVCELSMRFLYQNPAVVLGILLVVPMVLLLAGALFMKFAAKIFWVIWALWILGCMGIPRVADAMKERPDSFLAGIGRTAEQILSSESVGGSVVAAVILFTAGMTAIVLLLRKQRVTS